jgi:hypothetical protein
MFVSRYLAVGVLTVLAAAGWAVAEDPSTINVNEKQFRQACCNLLDNPLAKTGQDEALKIMRFCGRNPSVQITLSNDERRWFGADQARAQLLLSGYLAGNAQSQLNSGVPRNDRYSGLVSMFQVYRKLKDSDASAKNPEIENLLKLHREEKLQGYLTELDKKPADAKTNGVVQTKG